MVKPDGKLRPKETFQNLNDSKSEREYFEDLKELRRDLEAAKKDHDEARSVRLEKEIEELMSVLNKVLPSDSGEKSRNNVRKAIQAVVGGLRKGGRAEKNFATHIKDFIDLGYDVMYKQPKSFHWD